MQILAASAPANMTSVKNRFKFFYSDGWQAPSAGRHWTLHVRSHQRLWLRRQDRSWAAQLSWDHQGAAIADLIWQLRHLADVTTSPRKIAILHGSKLGSKRDVN
jgi:hypothetical protein